MNADEFKQRMAALEPKNKTPAPTYTWERHRQEIRSHCRRDDVMDFANWSTMRATMFVGNAPYIRDEFEALDASPLQWNDALREPRMGNPDPLPYAPHTSGNFVHQAYHLMRFWEATGLQIRDVGDVAEFGGGYGSLALIAQRLGHTGTWTFVDLPEMLLLLEFYLSNVGADMGRFRFELRLRKRAAYGLCVGLWSLSEAPLDDREAFVRNADAAAWLVSYQPRWHGVDNEEWFARLRARDDTMNWWDGKAVGGSVYLFGRRRDTA